MKKSLQIVASLILMFGTVSRAVAGTTNIYTQNWGTGNGNVVTGDGGLYSVGWSNAAVSQTTGPYLGIYVANPTPTDASGAGLPVNTVYFTVLSPAQTTPGMFYTTTEIGAGQGGNSTFPSLDPTAYTNLTLSVEARDDGGTPSNYFAVRIGSSPGTWYVSTNQLASSGGLAFPVFTNAITPYTNAASAWKTLTINATDVTIGSTPGSDLPLHGPITGIGIVELPTTGGFDYNQLAITAFVPNPPPVNPPTNTYANALQNVFEGGGVSLVTRFTGTAPLTYAWSTNGVPVPEGGRYFGTTNNTLIISNANLNDSSVTYSVAASNSAGLTNSPAGTLVLNVMPRPSDMLYSETLPYIGPSGNLPLTGVGWANAFGAAGSGGIFSLGSGQGAYFDYSGFTSIATNAAYTTVTNDTGLAGVPFASINIATHPVITFQAQFQPGNGPGRTAGAVITFWAVRVDGNWYSSAQQIPIDLTATSYLTNQYAFKTAASNWNTFTINGNIVTLGGPAANALSGNIDGAGLVFVHNAVNTSMNFENFLLSSNAVSIVPPAIGVNGAPWSQTVAAGGGVSFGVSATGTQPFTYGWTLNGVLLNNGGRFSGAHGPILTIANVGPADVGQVIAWVTNSVGVDDSLNSPNGGGGVDTELTVTNADVGVIYSETFPFVGPLPGNFSIGSEGWSEAVPGSPFPLFQRIGSDGAGFAFLGSANTVVYYTTATTDTNQAGLRFPNINLASYSDLAFSVDLAPSFSSSNVTAYFAVQLNGGNWYVSSSALPVPTATDSATYSTYSMAFNPAAVNWKNLSIGANNATIGSPAASNLRGVMTGIGLVFVTVGSGGTFNFDNVLVNGSGVGGINVGSLTGGTLNLSWVGNPAVNLQSNTNLNTSNWIDVPGTLGLYSFPAPTTGPQKFFRLKTP